MALDIAWEIGLQPTREFSSFNVGKVLKPGSYKSSRWTYFILNRAYQVRASLNSLHISLSVLPIYSWNKGALEEAIIIMIIVIWYPNHHHGKLWFSLFSLYKQVYFSANTGTKTAHDQISLISALCHLKPSFDIMELNAIRHFYIWYSW